VNGWVRMERGVNSGGNVCTADLPIGVFDSGLGGLTVVRQLHQTLPAEDLVYLGDTARVPYGTKSPATVVRFACEDTAFLCAQKVKAVVVACNTASAWALPELERQFALPIFGVIVPGAEAALARSARRRIGVIGTSATVRSGAYEKALHARDAAAVVCARACPLLVPLVEEGWLDGGVTEAVVREYLRPLLQEGIDTLVLGCTHYPLLKGVIQRVTGPEVALVDSAETCARFVQERLKELGLLRTGATQLGAIYPFVTDEVEKFGDVAARFLGVPLQPSAKVDLPVYPAGRAPFP
jgi:glutamate racemase